jgi:hypothetical protein
MCGRSGQTKGRRLSCTTCPRQRMIIYCIARQGAARESEACLPAILVGSVIHAIHPIPPHLHLHSLTHSPTPRADFVLSLSQSRSSLAGGNAASLIGQARLPTQLPSSRIVVSHPAADVGLRALASVYLLVQCSTSFFQPTPPPRPTNTRSRLDCFILSVQLQTSHPLPQIES